MIFELLKRAMTGIALSGIFTFLILTLMTIQSNEVPVFTIWQNMLVSMMIGIYFGCASMLFEIDRWSALKQTVTHALLSILVFFPLAIWIGWIPFHLVEILIGLGLFLVSYAMFWMGINWYLKRQAAFLNKAIRK